MEDGFYFDLQQKNLQYMQLQNMQRQRIDFSFDNNVILPANTGYRDLSIASSQSLASEFKKQSLDITGLISLQNQRLRLVLHEQSKQQLALVLKECESRGKILLRQKDEEIAKAMHRTTELQNILKKMETENQAWQRVAKEHEAIIMSMNNTMEKFQEIAGQSCNKGIDDAESWCDIMPEEIANKTEIKMICKSCNCRSSCVLLLPCRHLCSCKNCEAFIDSCPVCNMEKKGSIEALI